MAYHRATNESYQRWADLVGDQSYTFEQWLPFFQKSIHYTPPDKEKRASNATPDVDLDTLIGSQNGPVSITFSNYAQAASSWVQAGFKKIGINPISGFTSGKLLGSSYVLGAINATTQIRESSETSFLTSAQGNYNLSVYTSSLAKRILFNSNKTATGVQVDTAGSQYVISAKKEVILSAGAFQSPQLLMVSGIGPKTALQEHKIPVIQNLPGVGQNMWVSSNEHIHSTKYDLLIRQCDRTTSSWVLPTA
jgi:choline dehydrogenase